MLSTRAYQMLVIVCPAIALAAGALLYAHYPEFVWYSGSGIVATLSLVVYFARPDQTQQRVRWLTATLGQTHHACIALNLEGEIELFNAAAEELLGEGAADYIRKPFSELADVEAWASIQAERRKLLNDEPLQIHTAITVADKASLETRCAVTLIRSDADRPEYIQITLLDVNDDLLGEPDNAAETHLQQTL